MVGQNGKKLLWLKRFSERSEGANVEEGKKITKGKLATRAFISEQLDGRIISPGERKK